MIFYRSANPASNLKTKLGVGNTSFNVPWKCCDNELDLDLSIIDKNPETETLDGNPLTSSMKKLLIKHRSEDDLNLNHIPDSSDFWYPLEATEEVEKALIVKKLNEEASDQPVPVEQKKELYYYSVCNGAISIAPSGLPAGCKKTSGYDGNDYNDHTSELLTICQKHRNRFFYATKKATA